MMFSVGYISTGGCARNSKTTANARGGVFMLHLGASPVAPQRCRQSFYAARRGDAFK